MKVYSAENIIKRASNAYGVTISLLGDGKLRVVPAGKVTAQMREVIIQHKQVIIDFLTQEAESQKSLENVEPPTLPSDTSPEPEVSAADESAIAPGSHQDTGPDTIDLCLVCGIHGAEDEGIGNYTAEGHYVCSQHWCAETGEPVSAMPDPVIDVLLAPTPADPASNRVVAEVLALFAANHVGTLHGASEVEMMKRGVLAEHQDELRKQDRTTEAAQVRPQHRKKAS